MPSLTYPAEKLPLGNHAVLLRQCETK